MISYIFSVNVRAIGFGSFDVMVNATCECACESSEVSEVCVPWEINFTLPIFFLHAAQLRKWIVSLVL